MPLNLLRVKTGKGQITPITADLTSENLKLAEKLLALFDAHIKRKKGGLLNEASALEGDFDYRIVRGLSTILQRLCVFAVESAVDPLVARRLIFEEANRKGSVTSSETRRNVLCAVAHQLNVTEKQLENSFYADLENEMVLKEFRSIKPLELLKEYNLSLIQTLMFRSTFIQVRLSNRWKEVLREIKFRGLMYEAESRNGVFQITVDGPFSLLKLTQRYGTSMAKILPTIVQADWWEIDGRVVRASQFGTRVYRLNLTSARLGNLISKASSPKKQVVFDSSVEEKFYRRFQSFHGGWKILREPSPLIVGRHVFIPDFRFENNGLKVYMEIMGFWTRRYLESKIRKLRQLPDVDIIIAANEQLACDKLKQIKKEIIFYRGDVPLKPILKLLKNRREKFLSLEIQRLDLSQLRLDDDVVELHTIASEYDVSDEALRRKLKSLKIDGYTLIGDLLVSRNKLTEVGRKIAALNNPSISEAFHLLEAEGLKRPSDVLSALNYGIRWNGLDPDSSIIYEKHN